MTEQTAPAPGAGVVAAEPPRFFDSARPWLIPGGSWAAAYHDGLYIWPASQALRMARLRWITIAGDARNCGIADFEPGNPVFDQPGTLYGWAHGRIAMDCRARTYTDRANAAAALAALGGLHEDPHVEWWIATLDGRPWTPAELAADLAANWNAPIPADRIWACQNDRGPGYDTSRLFGPW